MSVVLFLKKIFTGENIPLFPAMIVQGLVVQGEGSTHPVESHHTPTSAPSTSQPPVSPTSRRTTRQESMVPQPRSPTQTPVVDEVASTGVDVRYGGATTTVTGLEAGQGSGNIDKTPTMPYDSPLPRVNTLGSDEGKPVVTTTSVAISTISPTRNTRVSTADDITMVETMVYIRKSAVKDKDKAVRLQVELEEEERPRMLEVTKQGKRKVTLKMNKARILADYQPRKMQLRGYSFDEIKISFKTIMRKVNTFVLIESEVDRAVPELAAGSSKRAAE
ncbi:hypothetical protein Tco_0890189 [Tanacetum coccineum]|uniref:Reverse transcriptase domain-containing protein n=1 Tax=Tanacetum coccineum TaxID=301880 RepID=A0ABQ5C2D3_9ASTR